MYDTTRIKLRDKLSGYQFKAIQILDGLMLGDGGITRYKNGTGIYYMSQSKRTISIKDHLKWLYWLRDNVFNILGITASVGLYQSYLRKDVDGKSVKDLMRPFQYARLQTEQSLLLAQIYDESYIGGEWITPKGQEDYPILPFIHEATKIVPKRSMEVSTLPILTLAPWFLGDGNSHRTPIGNVRLGFSTQGFSEREVYRLMEILNNMGVETTKPGYDPRCKTGSGLGIKISAYSRDYFISLVEPHIMEIFGDSESPSYKDKIMYTDSNYRNVWPSELNILRNKLNSYRR